MCRILLLILPILIGEFPLLAKDFPEPSKTYTVYINYEDYSVHAQVLSDAGHVHPKIGYTYYWYTDNDIKQTDGGYDGKLLHGEYKSFYLNKNLKEQGQFDQGLKDGEWITWYPNGRIHEIIHYRKSIEHGSYELYDEDGMMLSKSYFKNGMLSGKKSYYKKGKLDTIVIYKRGEIVPPKPARKSVHIKQKNKVVLTNKSDDSKRVQDSVAKPPKSRFSIKKVINKQKIKTKKENEKKGKSKKKDTASDTPKS